MRVHIVQDGEEDDEQFLIEVHLPPLVDRVQIDRNIFLHHRLTFADGARPVDLVEARVQVAQHEEKEVLIVAVELLQRQQDIKEGVALLQPPVRHVLHQLLLHHIALGMSVTKHNNGPIHPHGQLIDKVILLRRQQLLLGQVDDLLWRIFTEQQFLALNILQQHLRQNEHRVTATVVQRGVEIVAHVVHRHLAFDIPQVGQPRDDVLHRLGSVLVFFY